MIVLVELTGYTDSGVSQVYRYSTSGYRTKPTDTPANTWYAPRVKDPGSMSRSISNGSRQNPMGEVSFGAIVLKNADGQLDTVFGAGTTSFRERQFRVLTVEKGAAYSTAVVLAVGVIVQPALSATEVTISVKDSSYILASEHTTTLFAGTNSLPNGLEGLDDLKGKVKPLVYGKVLKMEPPCVNTTRLIYQVSNRAGQSVDGAYDGGVALTAGAAYSSQSDMETNAPSAGQYRVWLAGSAVYVRLGTKPEYGLTLDVTGDTPGNSTVAQLLKTLALARGWASGDINASDVTALDALNSAVTGILVDDSRSTLDLMSDLANSVGANFWCDRLGVLRMIRLELPTGTAQDVIATWRCRAVTLTTSGQDVPAGTVRLKYAKYWKTQGQSELATSVTAADASDLAQEHRVAVYSATPSPNPHYRLVTIERSSLLVLKSAADTEAQRLQTLWAGSRRVHRCEGVQLLNTTSTLNLDLGSVVELRWNRYGFDPVSGTLRRIIAMTVRFRNLSCDLTLWGS